MGLKLCALKVADFVGESQNVVGKVNLFPAFADEGAISLGSPLGFLINSFPQIDDGLPQAHTQIVESFLVGAIVGGCPGLHFTSTVVRNRLAVV